MFYLGIDQHAKQLTANLRDSAGDVVLRRQVSTRPEKVLEFFERITQRCIDHDCGFWAVIEVCGFNDWLLEMLKNFRCDRIVLVQPEGSDRPGPTKECFGGIRKVKNDAATRHKRLSFAIRQTIRTTTQKPKQDKQKNAQSEFALKERTNHWKTLPQLTICFRNVLLSRDIETRSMAMSSKA